MKGFPIWPWLDQWGSLNIYDMAEPTGQKRITFQRVGVRGANTPHPLGKTRQTRKWVIPIDPKTRGQMTARQKMKMAVAEWHITPPEERQLFKPKADQRRISTYMQFISEYIESAVIAPGTIWDGGRTRWDLGLTEWDTGRGTIWDTGATRWDGGLTLWDLPKKTLLTVEEDHGNQKKQKTESKGKPRTIKNATSIKRQTLSLAAVAAKKEAQKQRKARELHNRSKTHWNRNKDKVK